MAASKAPDRRGERTAIHGAPPSPTGHCFVPPEDFRHERPPAVMPKVLAHGGIEGG